MSVSVSRANGACVKKTCAKTGIYLIGETPACRTHVRQVLDEALRAAEVVAFDDLDSSHTPGQWSAAVKKEQDARSVMVSGKTPDSEEGKAALADLAQAALKLADETCCRRGCGNTETEIFHHESYTRACANHVGELRPWLGEQPVPVGEGPLTSSEERRERREAVAAKVECICPVKPCAFCALPLKDRVAMTGGCTRPDVDVDTMICGHPLPCPRHPGGNR